MGAVLLFLGLLLVYVFQSRPCYFCSTSNRLALFLPLARTKLSYVKTCGTEVKTLSNTTQGCMWVVTGKGFPGWL